MLIKKHALLITLFALLISARFYFFYTSQVKSGPITITSTVANNPRESRGSYHFLVGKYLVYTYDSSLNYGDQVQVNGTLKNGYIAAKSVKKIPATGLDKILSEARSRFSKTIKDNLPSPQAELLIGILLGIKTDLPTNFKNSLVNTGTIHVVVVSGYNIALVAGFFLFLAPYLGRKKASFFALSVILLYTLLVGPSAPTLRAAIMGGLTLIGVILGRQVIALYLLFISAYLLLLFKPDYLFDLSFQLSFLATFGVVTLTKDVEKFFSFLPKGVSTSLSTTLAAQVLVLPVLFYNFGQVSLSAPLVNTLVLWTVPLATIAGFALLGVSLLNHLLTQLVSLLVYPPLTFFVTVVNSVGSLNFLSLQVPLGNHYLVVGYLLLVAALYLLRWNFLFREGQFERDNKK